MVVLRKQVPRPMRAVGLACTSGIMHGTPPWGCMRFHAECQSLHVDATAGWNILDFIVVVLGYMEFAADGNYSAIRSVRVLRPLRLISQIEALRVSRSQQQKKKKQQQGEQEQEMTAQAHDMVALMQYCMHSVHMQAAFGSCA